MQTRGLPVVILLVALVTAGCPSGVTSVTALITSKFADKVPDEFGVALPPAVQWEIDTVVTERTGSTPTDTLTVRVTFVQAAAIPAAGAAAGSAQIAGVIEFDTDQNAATGLTPSFTTTFCPAPGGIGPERGVDLFTRNADGTYNVLNAAFVDVGDATPSVSGNTLSVAIPLSALGDDGVTDMDMVLGSGVEPTDCAPDAGGGVITKQPVRAPWRSPSLSR